MCAAKRTAAQLPVGGYGSAVELDDRTKSLVLQRAIRLIEGMRPVEAADEAQVRDKAHAVSESHRLASREAAFSKGLLQTELPEGVS